jgi:hypothetical protein
MRRMSLPPPSPDSTALVTGASSGIGASIARKLAERGHGVTLVARRADRLTALATELADAHGIRAEVVACDLSDGDARAALVASVAELGLDVDILVNNAGFATGGRFQESDPAQEVQQVRVLCEAPVALVSAFLPGMVERRRGAILNVASTAGMQPIPFSAGYAAAKAHALSFSESLHAEVAPVGVTVTALCPGPVATEFWDLAGDQPIEDSVPGPLWTSTDDVAQAGLDGLDSGDRVVVPGLPMRAVMFGGRFVPNFLKLPVMARTMKPKQ